MERGQAGEAGRVRSWPRRLLAALMKWYRMDWDEARARARVREARRPARRPCSGISLDRGRKDGGKGPTGEGDIWRCGDSRQRHGCLLDFQLGDQGRE